MFRLAYPSISACPSEYPHVVCNMPILLCLHCMSGLLQVVKAQAIVISHRSKGLLDWWLSWCLMLIFCMADSAQGDDPRRLGCWKQQRICRQQRHQAGVMVSGARQLRSGIWSLSAAEQISLEHSVLF